MRYLGIALMAASLTGAGFLAAGRLRERFEILLLFKKLAYALKGEILYSNSTLSEALFEVGRRFLEGRSGHLKEPGLFFLRVKGRMEKERGTPFFVLWKEEAGKFPADFPMEKADMQALCGLGETLGYADRDMQERTLLLYLEQLEDSMAYLKKEMDARMKLLKSLGAAAGLFLAVIML